MNVTFSRAYIYFKVTRFAKNLILKGNGVGSIANLFGEWLRSGRKHLFWGIWLVRTKFSRLLCQSFSTISIYCATGMGEQGVDGKLAHHLFRIVSPT